MKYSIKHLGRILIVSILVFCSIHTLFSQNITIRKENDSIIVKNNFITYGFEKIVNTYLFKAQAILNYELDFGVIDIKQNYLGTGLQSSVISFRDDEFLDVNYSYPILQNLSIFSDNKWLYSNDTRSIGLNKIQKLRTILGTEYAYLPNSKISVGYGYEDNEQIGITSDGSALILKANLNNFDYDGFKLNSDIFGDFVTLNDDRNYNQFYITGDVFKKYDDLNSIYFYIKYKNYDQDFLHPVSSSDDFNIEKRLENRIQSTFNLRYSFTDNLFSKLNLSLDNSSISRSYNSQIKGNSMSGVFRDLNEFQLNFGADINYTSNFLNQTVSVAYYSRNEDNRVVDKFNIDPTEFNSILQQENTKDNISARTRLQLKSDLFFSDSDILTLNFFSSIFRYNTPSINNNDERDELTLITNMNYYHTFSDYLKLNVEGELQLIHMVFLKSERSALNNWNRIVRLSPGIIFQGKKIFMSPKFEVLANYTVYDYEDLSAGVQSYSFRQISYKDSILFRAWNTVSIMMNMNYRYFERGIFFWDDFAESPQNRSYEQYNKLLLLYHIDELSYIGSGIRYYGLFQKNLSTYAFSNSETYQISFGPEIEVRLKDFGGIELKLNGWYELQKTNNEAEFKGIPNILLETIINL